MLCSPMAHSLVCALLKALENLYNHTIQSIVKKNRSPFLSHKIQALLPDVTLYVHRGISLQREVCFFLIFKFRMGE